MTYEMKMREAHDDGKEEGRKEGRREGRKEGRREGRKEGQEETLQALLSLGIISADDMKKATDKLKENTALQN